MKLILFLMKNFCYLIFILFYTNNFCFGQHQSRDEFLIIADQIQNFIVPAFSSSSNSTTTIEDFIETFNFLLTFPNLPKTITIYNEKNICELIKYKNKTLHLWGNCGIIESTKIDTENDSKIIQLLYEISLTSDVTKFLRKADLSLKHENQNQQMSNNKLLIRTNFIILTDLPKIGAFYDSISIDLQKTLYFIISNAIDGHQENIFPAHKTEQYFYVNEAENISAAEVDKIILNNTLIYQLYTSANKFNVFIICDDESTILDYSIDLAENLIKNGDSFYDKNGNLLPKLFVASIKKNDSFYYQTATVHLNDTKLPSSALTSYYQSSSNHFSTSLVEEYFKKAYNKYTHNDFIQWNIIITNKFPTWLKETGLVLDSFNHHLDIYLLTNNSNVAKLIDELKENLNIIIIENKDGNASFRANHFIIQNIEKPLNLEEFPTLKKRMTAATFDYPQRNIKPPKNEWWIWVIAIFSVAFIIAGLIILFLYRRRQQRKTCKEGKYPASPPSKILPNFFPPQIETFDAKRNILFVEQNQLKIDVNKILGKGVSSIVYEGHLNGASPVTILYPRLETTTFANCKVAMKIANTITKDEFEQVFREIDAALKIGFHRHICCLLGWTIYQQIPALIFEFIDGKDLISWIKTSKKIEKSDKIIAQILWQIADGMEHIASKGVVHKDLAARNILLTSRLEVKVADFGLASLTNESFTYQASYQRRLPIRWMAPEALTQRLFSESSDVWSFGILAWELFTNGMLPYGGIDGNDIVDFLMSDNRLVIPENVSDEWKVLIKECWIKEREKRPNFSQIKNNIELILEKYNVNDGYIIICKNENNKI